mgnify:CR=1 FL=1
MRELREETGIEAAAYGGLVDWDVANEFEIFTQCATMHRLDVFLDAQFIRPGHPPIRA